MSVEMIVGSHGDDPSPLILAILGAFQAARCRSMAVMEFHPSSEEALSPLDFQRR
jgi:hypothetical protein